MSSSETIWNQWNSVLINEVKSSVQRSSKHIASPIWSNRADSISRTTIIYFLSLSETARKNLHYSSFSFSLISMIWIIKPLLDKTVFVSTWCFTFLDIHRELKRVWHNNFGSLLSQKIVTHNLFIKQF